MASIAQSQSMVNTLKRKLRARRVSYEQIARHLGLSLSTVKRLFSAGGFTLRRLEAVCELAEVDLLELARDAESERLRVTSLTVEQERELVADPELLLVAICALGRWRFERIFERYQMTRPHLIKLLVRLDRLGLIELLPENRIKLRVAPNFAWLPDGPIHRYFVNHVQAEFLTGAFDPDRDLHRFAWGMLTAESAAVMRAKMADLVESFHELARQDEVRPRHETRVGGTCLLVALREWEPAAFRAKRRTPGDGEDGNRPKRQRRTTTIPSNGARHGR